MYKGKIIQFLRLKEIFKIKVTPKKNNLSISRSKTLQKREIIQRKNIQLIDKFYLFFKFLFERIYTNILLCIINICLPIIVFGKMITELYLEATKKNFDTSISNNKRKQEKFTQKKNNPMPFVSPEKGTLDKSKINSYIFYDVSYVSQAYVFLKLSQLQIKNPYKFVYQYKGIRPFVKKTSFARQGIIIVRCQLTHKKMPSYEITQWKKWLRGHYQYDLSEIKRSGLIPKKRRNRVDQRRIIQKENISKWASDEKDQLQLIPLKKKLLIYSLYNNKNKENFEKFSNYDLLAYKFLNSEKKSFFSRPAFQGNNNQESFLNTPKETLFEMLNNRTLLKYRDDILYTKKDVDKKYLDCQILKFDLREKNDIETWLTSINTQIYRNNFKKILSFLKLPEIKRTNSRKGFSNWMGMNAERRRGSIGNPELWFFSEFIFLYKIYKKTPWCIPSKLLLLNLNINEKNRNENKKTKEKDNLLLLPKKKPPNKDEKEPQNQKDPESLPPQKNDIEEDSPRSEGKNIKQYKSKIEAELDLFLKRYFIFQLRGNNALTQKMLSNIKVYCLLLKLMDPKRITLSSIQKKELNLNIMLIDPNLTLKELLNKKALIIEPIRLSGKKDGQFIMYQIINICLIHKSKHQTNQKDQEQKYVSKSHLAEIILPHQRITANINKNFDLIIPENILSLRHCRTLRICIYLNSKNKDVEINTLACNGKNVKNSEQVSNDNNDLDTEKNLLMKFKGFLWPNYRLEDLACMNRYWFNTTNGSRLNMLRLQFYSQLKTRG